MREKTVNLRLKRILHRLGLRGGVEAVLYNEDDGELDFSTGEIESTITTTKIRRFVTWAVKEKMTHEYAVNSKFGFGVEYEIGDRYGLILDTTIKSGTFAVYLGERYNFIETIDLDGLGYLVLMRKTTGRKQKRVIDAKFTSVVGIEQSNVST